MRSAPPLAFPTRRPGGPRRYVAAKRLFEAGSTQPPAPPTCFEPEPEPPRARRPGGARALRECLPAFAILGGGAAAAALAEALDARRDAARASPSSTCGRDPDQPQCSARAYAKQFPASKRGPIAFFDEFRLNAAPRTASWFAATAPRAKFVVVVRSPADDGVDDEDDACYADGLQKWRLTFPADRFLVVKAEDFWKPGLLDDVSAFLGLAGAWPAPLSLPPSRVSPERRVDAACAPAALDCERRLEAALRGRPGSLGWCRDARRAAPPGYDVQKRRPRWRLWGNDREPQL